METKGYYVDGAGNLQNALQLVNVKTYHVALVDIMLGGKFDRLNRDGLKILKRMQELDEGNQRVVLSGQDEERQLVRDILKDYEAFDYLDKVELYKRGFSLLYDMISRALKNCQIALYGWQKVKYVSGEKMEPKDVLSFLAGTSGNVSIWVDRCLRALQPKGGYIGLQRFLKNFCDPLAPMMPLINVVEPASIDERRRLLGGKFWSKSLGEAIEVVALATQRETEFVEKQLESRWSKNNEIKRFETAGLSGFAFRLEGTERSLFIDKSSRGV